MQLCPRPSSALCRQLTMSAALVRLPQHLAQSEIEGFAAELSDPCLTVHTEAVTASDL